LPISNTLMFLRELCDALDLPPPDPAGDPETNDYVFERVVKEPGRDGTVSSRRIALYERGSFVLEAKQSLQQSGGDKEVQGQTDLFLTSQARRGTDRSAPPRPCRWSRPCRTGSHDPGRRPAHGAQGACPPTASYAPRRHPDGRLPPPPASLRYVDAAQTKKPSTRPPQRRSA
jgi:hypothetical protein